MEHCQNYFVFFKHDSYSLFLRYAGYITVSLCVVRERLLQFISNSEIIYNQSSWLVFKDPVNPGYCLHEPMSAHWFINVHCMKTGNIKACQPHGADNGDSERVLRVLKRVVHVHALVVGRLEPVLHPHAMRDDVEAPSLEVAYLVLRSTDNDLDDRAFHPLRLSAQPLQGFNEALPLIHIRRSG